MSQIFIPTSGPDDWQQFLAEPEKQWKTGYSAKSLAYSWEEAIGFPTEIEAAINTSADELHGLKPLIVIPEHKVPLPGGTAASQNDIFVLASNEDALAAVCVEGKVNESFDKLVSEWNPDGSKGRRQRFDYLKELLGLGNGNDLGHIRYQLLHRTASAIIEAQRFHAQLAIMLVHSFSQEHMWYDDFNEFARLFGISPQVGDIQFAGKRSGVDLYLGWVMGNREYLTR